MRRLPGGQEGGHQLWPRWVRETRDAWNAEACALAGHAAPRGPGSESLTSVPGGTAGRNQEGLADGEGSCIARKAAVWPSEWEAQEIEERLQRPVAMGGSWRPGGVNSQLTVDTCSRERDY